MKCEYENTVHKIIELAKVIDKRKTALWVNGNLDKQVKGRIMTIGKILNQDVDTGDKNCNLQNVSNNEALESGDGVAVCPVCNTLLDEFLDGRKFCSSCLKIYRAN